MKLLQLRAFAIEHDDAAALELDEVGELRELPQQGPRLVGLPDADSDVAVELDVGLAARVPAVRRLAPHGGDQSLAVQGCRDVEGAIAGLGSLAFPASALVMQFDDRGD